MARMGMDVDVVNQHGAALTNIGDSELPALVNRVDAIVGDIQANWWGPDAQHFHSSWTGTDKPALTHIGVEMAGFGKSAVINAQAQTTTSASTNGPSA